MDLKVFNFHALVQLQGQDLNNSFFICLESNEGLITSDFFPPKHHVSASVEISLKMMGGTCHIVELNQSSFFFIEGVNFQIVFMQNDTVGTVMLENIRIDFFE